MATAPTMTIRVDRKGLKKLKALARRLEKVSDTFEKLDPDNLYERVASRVDNRQLQEALERRDGEIASLNRRLEGANRQINDAWKYCDLLKIEVVRLQQKLKENEK